MKSYVECVPCALNQCINTLNVSGVSEDLKEKTVSKLIEKLKNYNFNIPPSYNSDMAYETCKEVTKISDPYYKLKKKYNKLALEIYPELSDIVKSSNDPLYTAAKISVEGNIIDLGINLHYGKEVDFKKIINDISNIPLAINDYNKFKDSLEDAENILYIGDNAGEIVFDKIFVREILKKKKNVIFSVKSGPIINDATMEDAKETGITDLVKVIETGAAKSGVNFNYVSEEFIKIFRGVDLIISKGQANFECLDEIDKNIFFILKAKCARVANSLGVNYLDVVLVKKKQKWGNKKV